MMEKDYKGILNHYIDSEIRNQSKNFLENFWLTDAEKLSVWTTIKDKVFCSDSKDIPDLIFKEGFDLLAIRGGILFTKEEYYALQSCMKVAGDKYFVLIENEFARREEGDFPHLQFKFPIGTSWAELNNGDENSLDISYEVLYIMNKHFFIFGDSGKWGKYAASNYNNTPIDIVGFKPELASIFREQFKQSKEDQEEIREWLPQKYKELIK